VHDNTVTDSGWGIQVEGEILSGASVKNNTTTGNQQYGLNIQEYEAPATAKNVVQGNTSTGNGGAGIVVYGAWTTITHNVTEGNGGLGIDLSHTLTGDGVTDNDAGDGDSFLDNPLLNFPVITGDDGVNITGTACGQCVIEVYESDGDPSGHGEGKRFLVGALTSDQGQFVAQVCGLDLPPDAQVTATATNLHGDTSEFSANYTFNGSGDCPTPEPTATPGPESGVQGDFDCDGEITPLDALVGLRFAQGLAVMQEQPCPSLDELFGGFAFGDVNCDGVIDGLDALAIAEYFSGFDPAFAPPCVTIGSPL
jgi:Right handed beta helix region